MILGPYRFGQIEDDPREDGLRASERVGLYAFEGEKEREKERKRDEGGKEREKERKRDEGGKERRKEGDEGEKERERKRGMREILDMTPVIDILV
jgi:hypothetical protein